MPKKKQTGQEFTDDLFLRMLGKSIRGFTDLAFKEQFHLAQLILSANQKRRRHYRYDTAFAMPYQDLYRRFGRGRFEAINRNLELFLTSEQWWSQEGEGKAYWLTKKVSRVREKYLRLSGKKIEGQFVYENGTHLAKPPRAIASKAKDGNSARNQGREITPLTPIDADNLLSYAKTLNQYLQRLEDYHTPDLFMPQNPKILRRKARERLDYVRMLLRWMKTDIGQNRYLIHRYVEARTGRLYAEGPANLQNGIREVRQVALQGRYDYDFENCHYSLFQQLVEAAGGKAEAISYYLANKRTVRQELSDHLKRPVEIIKQCLLAKIYGAETTEYWKAAIPSYLGQEGARRFHAHPLVQQLERDLEIGRDIIIEAQKVSRRGLITNAMRRKIKATEEPKIVLAHILQGLEARMLEMARERYAGQIILLQHDGFTTLKQVNYRPLLKQIERELGVSMEMSEELLQTPSHLVPDEPIKPNRETDFSLLESTRYDNFYLLSAS